MGSTIVDRHVSCRSEVVNIFIGHLLSLAFSILHSLIATYWMLEILLHIMSINECSFWFFKAKLNRLGVGESTPSDFFFLP